MTQHKYAEMIKIKAYNMDLVVFIKNIADDDWRIRGNQDSTYFEPTCEYFLCHPKHQKECLHWLNGGEVEFYCDGEWRSCKSWKKEWSGTTSGFMSEANVLHIKPQKVQKWLVVYNSNLTVSPALLSEPIEATDEYQVIPVMVEVANDN